MSGILRQGRGHSQKHEAGEERSDLQVVYRRSELERVCEQPRLRLGDAHRIVGAVGLGVHRDQLVADTDVALGPKRLCIRRRSASLR